MPPKIPYNLKAANKIRSELQEHFTKHFERPEVTEKDSFTRQLSCEKLTYTYETRINIPYKNTVLREDESNFLNKIDSLMNRECCFFVTCNTLRDKHIENVVMTLKVESPCKVNSTIS